MSDKREIQHARITIERQPEGHRWRPWVWTVEHSLAGTRWWVWSQGRATSEGAARRRAIRHVSPPYGEPLREELYVVREFPWKPEKPEPLPLAVARHVGEDKAA